MAQTLTRNAEAFIAIGGRIALSPTGEPQSFIDTARLYERTRPDGEPPAPFEQRRRIANAFARSARRNRAAIAAMVKTHGRQTANGWQVWEGR